ncbi:MAG: hypothetical protein MUF49_11505 [Oculatellaceae cyanobacterium Prado106]|jgi:hypothetical protein|nr:hypothetical protein [Oculatellaceae cyanobacterium Prado106]
MMQQNEGTGDRTLPPLQRILGRSGLVRGGAIAIHPLKNSMDAIATRNDATENRNDAG